MKKPTLPSHQLFVFSVLAQRMSFTLAARDLMCTQSAVSHSLDALERAVGMRLYRYISHRVYLTRAGEQVLRHTKVILREMVALRTSINRLEGMKMPATPRSKPGSKLSDPERRPKNQRVKSRRPRLSLAA